MWRTLQICSSHRTRAFLSTCIKLSSCFPEISLQQSESNVCMAVFAAAVVDVDTTVCLLMWCWDVGHVGFLPVDLVKSSPPPFLLASLASSIIHTSSSFIDASMKRLFCLHKSLLSLIGGKVLSQPRQPWNLEASGGWDIVPSSFINSPNFTLSMYCFVSQHHVWVDFSELHKYL